MILAVFTNFSFITRQLAPTIFCCTMLTDAGQGDASTSSSKSFITALTSDRKCHLIKYDYTVQFWLFKTDYLSWWWWCDDFSLLRLFWESVDTCWPGSLTSTSQCQLISPTNHIWENIFINNQCTALLIIEGVWTKPLMIKDDNKTLKPVSCLIK